MRKSSLRHMFLALFLSILTLTAPAAFAVSQVDVLNAKLAVLQNQIAGIDLQAAAQKAVVNVNITAVEAEIAKLTSHSSGN